MHPSGTLFFCSGLPCVTHWVALRHISTIDTIAGKIVSGSDYITWNSVPAIMKSLSIVHTCKTIRGVANGQPAESVLVERTLFPVTLASSLADPSGMQMSRLPLIFGHESVWAWYISMLQALDAHATGDVLRLLQCASTPSIQIKTCLTDEEQA